MLQKKDSKTRIPKQGFQKSMKSASACGELPFLSSPQLLWDFFEFSPKVHQPAGPCHFGWAAEAAPIFSSFHCAKWRRNGCGFLIGNGHQAAHLFPNFTLQHGEIMGCGFSAGKWTPSGPSRNT